MMTNKMIFTIALLATTVACSSKIVKQDQLSKVHRAAIIGLDVQQQKAVSGEDLASIALKSASKSQATPALRVDGAHVDQVYKDLAAKISAKTGWQVVSLNEVRQNAAYAKFFKDKTEGFQQRPIVNDRFVVYAPPGITDAFAVQTSKSEKLAELARALKVDAVIFASSTVNLNNSSMLMSMVGKGEFHPSASTTIFVLDGRSGEKIFMDSASGPKLDEGAKNTLGMADEQKLNGMAQQATALAVDMALKELKR